MHPPASSGSTTSRSRSASIEEALAFYGRFFDLRLRGVAPGMAFIDMGDQFLALSEGREQGPDDGRHFGLVVDDKDAVRAALEAAGVEIEPGRRLDFRDPGATGSRSSTTATSSSPRRRRCSAAWASRAREAPERARASCARRACSRASRAGRRARCAKASARGIPSSSPR